MDTAIFNQRPCPPLSQKMPPSRAWYVDIEENILRDLRTTNPQASWKSIIGQYNGRIKDPQWKRSADSLSTKWKLMKPAEQLPHATSSVAPLPVDTCSGCGGRILFGPVYYVRCSLSSIGKEPSLICSRQTQMGLLGKIIYLFIGVMEQLVLFV